MPSVNVGQPAPDFTLPTDGGGTTSLAALKGKKVVIYFYPKADTPGCTIEAKDFSRMKAEFAAADTEIIGVSADPVKAQDKFKTKHDLTITLASDETLSMLNAYGVWVEKSMYGKKYMGIERVTVLVDRDGTVARVWPKVKIEGHTDEVLSAAKAL
jgi:thioredoxin-dependent peroxiredoxin